jgi:hypothetical protein
MENLTSIESTQTETTATPMRNAHTASELIAQARKLITEARELKEIEDFEHGQMLQECSEISPEIWEAEDKMLDHHFESQYMVFGMDL